MIKHNRFKKAHFICIVLLLVLSNQILFAQKIRRKDLKKDIELVTDLGSIVLRLSDQTPGHRNNFIRLVKAQYYDNVIFHRVIDDFLIQTGGHRTSEDSLTTHLSLDVPDTISAEINEDLFHQRGAINAARFLDDDNPTQASSGTQFTIIQGGKKSADAIDVAEGRINNLLAYNKVINDPANKVAYEEYLAARSAQKPETPELRAKLHELRDAELKMMTKYAIPAGHRQIYETIGGTPHLDQNYVVFGHVIKGMDIVDALAKVETDGRANPKSPVKILKARLIKRKDY